MGAKGEQTKRLICMEAYKLFSEKGYKDVTMKDICERTKLSRGGLYRHYKSTEQIFLKIVNFLMENQQNEFKEKIQRNMAVILLRKKLCIFCLCISNMININYFISSIIDYNLFFTNDHSIALMI